MGDPDAPHSWTYVDDIGALTARLACEPSDSDSWGRAWHVPTDAPKSVRQVVADACALADFPTPKVALLPALVRKLARVSPLVRSLDETEHQFRNPFVLDSSAAQWFFGLAPTLWADGLRETVEAMVGRQAVAAR